MNVHILTYATHSEGMFESLKQDAMKNYIDLTIIGWKEKWTGFFGKLKAVQNHLELYENDDIVIVIDAFDTRIIGNIEQILTKLKNNFENDSVIFSKDGYLPFMPKFVSAYITNRIFGGDLNAGLYLGKVKYLRKLYDDTLKFEKICKKDDQCAFNKMIKTHNIVIDEKRIIFDNVDQRNRNKSLVELKTKSDAIFFGFPGKITFDRLKRIPAEYAPFFKVELTLLFLLILFVVVKVTFKKK